MHYWQKLCFEMLGGISWRKVVYYSNPVSRSCCLVTWSSSILSFSLSSFTPKQLWRRAVSVNACPGSGLHQWLFTPPFDWRCTLIMFSPYGRTVLEYEAGMQQWNFQLVRCQSIFPIFYQHRLFNKIDFTGRSILWPVIYKYMWARKVFAQ